MKKILKFSIMFLLAVSLTACGSDEDATVVNDAITAQTIEASAEMPPVVPSRVKETYWTVPVQDYEVILRDADQYNAMEILVKKEEQEWSILTFDTTDNYRVPEDITIDTFEDVMGHSGFRIYECYEMGSEVVICGTDYFAVDEEPIHLALSWACLSSREDEKTPNVYSADLDGDGTMELLCNVQWLADGKIDTKIYHWDGEKVYTFGGTEVMIAEESDIDITYMASFGAEYLPDKNMLLISHWDEATQSLIEKEYEINLEKLEMYEFQ